MVGMTVMLSSVRADWAPGDGEADPLAYRAVWTMSAILCFIVHIISWTIGGGSQYKQIADDDDDPRADSSVYEGATHMEHEKEHLLGSDDSDDNEGGDSP